MKTDRFSHYPFHASAEASWLSTTTGTYNYITNRNSRNRYPIQIYDMITHTDAEYSDPVVY